MKKVYLKHYWLLYAEFIEAFKDIKYHEIPLALLCNFYQHIDAELREKMSKPEFINYLEKKEFDNLEIQSDFEKLLRPLKKHARNKPIQGKTLLNFDYLRFPPQSFKYFDPLKTVVFARWRAKSYLGLPVYSIRDYKTDLNDISVNYIEKVNEVFLKYNNHPAFNNEHFQNTFIKRIPAMLDTVAAIEKYLDEVSIGCIVVGTTEDIISRSLTVIGGKRGIPSICMQHGVIMGEEAFLPVFSSKVAVYGQYEKDWYKGRGLSEDRIEITGHPRYDAIFTEKHMNKEDFQKKYGLNPNKKWIMCATQPNNEELWEDLLLALVKEQNIEIIIKPHPWELSRKKLDQYEKFSKKYSNVKLIDDKKVDLYDLLPNIDYTVINFSTVGLESMLFNKCVFVMKKEYVDRDYVYYDRLGEFARFNVSEVIELLKKVLTDKSTETDALSKKEKFVKNSYPEKVSINRVIKLVQNMMGER